jgi:hypothetical protein
VKKILHPEIIAARAWGDQSYLAVS